MPSKTSPDPETEGCPRPVPRRPADCHDDEEIDRSTFQKINTIGKQRNRTDRARHVELDAEISEVENCHQPDNAAQRVVCEGAVHSDDVRGPQRAGFGQFRRLDLKRRMADFEMCPHLIAG